MFYLVNYVHSLQPHQDGSAYYPLVAILSLGSPVVMDFTPHSRLGQSIETIENNESSSMLPFSVVMMPRGLLIFKDNAYSGMLLLHFIVFYLSLIIVNVFVPWLLDYLHGITDSEVQQIDKVCLLFCIHISLFFV